MALTGGRLTPESFARFLAALDPDPAEAGVRYEELRASLMLFFEGRGFAIGDELADEVIDRVCRRLHEGESIRGIPAYAHGVAARVAQEAWRRQRRAPPAPSPAATEAEESERRDRCLALCLQRLPEDQRRLLFRYYSGGGEARQAERRRMAADHALSPAGLRSRLHRLREDLQTWMEQCLEKTDLKHPASSDTSE
jgi:DNA-directed RNA polymerase specialized sigma24 family protein